jgi:hypothetical protein
MLVMLGGSDRSVADILSDQGRSSGDGGNDQGDVEAWLAEFLSAGPVSANDVYRAADAHDYSKDRAKRAKKKLGVLAIHPDITGPWFGCSLGEGGTHHEARLETGPLGRPPSTLLPLRPASHAHR